MLQLENICRKAGEFRLENVNLNLENGEYHVLLGPSGAGKTMLMEIVTGLIKADSGKVFVDGMDVTRAIPGNRKTGMVYQDSLLFDHMSVRQNIAYSAAMRKLSAAERSNSVDTIAAELRIEHLLSRNPAKLSGGEKQRVALARALVMKPSLLLLDEPLASLDVMLRDDVMTLLLALKEKKQTILHITHRYEEALLLADRISVIRDGKIVQSGSREDVFASPASLFTAKFSGHPNCFSYEEAIGFLGKNNLLSIWDSDENISANDCFVVVDPCGISISPENFEKRNFSIEAMLISVQYTGMRHAMLKFESGQRLTVSDNGNANIPEGMHPFTKVICCIPPESISVFKNQ